MTERARPRAASVLRNVQLLQRSHAVVATIRAFDVFMTARWTDHLSLRSSKKGKVQVSEARISSQWHAFDSLIATVRFL